MIRKLLLFAFSFHVYFGYSTDLRIELCGLDYLEGEWEGYWGPGNDLDENQAPVSIKSYVLTTQDGNLVQILFYEPKISFSPLPKDNCLVVHYKWNEQHQKIYLLIEESIHRKKKSSFTSEDQYLINPKQTFIGNTITDPNHGKVRSEIVIKSMNIKDSFISINQHLILLDHKNKNVINPSIMYLQKTNDSVAAKLKLYHFMSDVPPSPSHKKQYALYCILETLPIDWSEFKFKINTPSEWRIEEKVESEDLTNIFSRLNLDEDSSSPTKTQNHKTDEFPLS